ncbi:MAG: Rrf2 family transcriptional regulator [Acidimicrobiia bacterium]
MQLKLGKRADYAIRAVLSLARHVEANSLTKSRDIAAEMDIPAKYLPQVLATLVRAGLVNSVPGPDGGYRLTKAPEEVTLLDVIEGVEGPLRSAECILRGGPCHWETACALHEPWAKAKEAMLTNLASTNFGDLAAADSTLATRYRSS